MVEQNIGSVGHNLILSGVGHLAVVKVIPLTIILVACIAGVMSISESSVVIGHSDEVITAWRLPTGQTFPQEAAREIQVSEGEVHDAVELLPGELGVGEPLEVDDENLRQRPEVQLLRG